MRCGVVAAAVVCLMARVLLLCTPPGCASVQNIAHLGVRNHRAGKHEVVSSHGRADGASVLPAPSTLSLCRRAVYLAYIFTPVVSTAWLGYCSRIFRQHVWYGLVTSALAKGGAAFIKWGQWASTRPDMFPESLCESLARLHANAPAHSFEFTARQIQDYLGAPLDQIFDSFPLTPVASGSIAQVYVAYLAGERVAVKVRHPNVAEQIDMDFRLMRVVAEFIDSYPALKWLNLAASMDQFSHTIASQTRLDIEGRHLDIFNNNFRRWKDLRFPQPYYLTEAVLIESYEEGFSISEYVNEYSKWKKSLEDTNFLTKAVRWLTFTTAPPIAERSAEHKGLDHIIAHFIVSTGEDVYLKMLLVDNLMHADLHPGNILIQVKGPQSKLVLVDAGMVARLEEEEQENFIGLLKAMGAGDGRQAASCVLRFGSGYSYSPAEEHAFTFSMESLFEKTCRGYGTNVDVGEVLRGVLKLVREHKIRIGANYATLVMNVLCLDGLAQSLMPQYNILDAAKPLLTLHAILCKTNPGKFLFRLVLPLAQGLKALTDRWVLSRISRKIVEDEAMEPVPIIHPTMEF